jgi:eukaryotic-like serine/threonine-protein kinase
MVGELQTGDPPSIGPYRLLGRLGTGGMGQVFLGRSAGGRLVAVKVIRPDLAEEQDFRARFGREVAAARNVNGQFTALVAGADVEGPVPWLATAYVSGPSLSEAVAEQGPMPASSVMMLAAGLAEGLGAIHAAGVVHRDLKPSNVLLAHDGPRVIDFGISRATESSMLTQAGTVVGSPGFMSPEQAEGGEVGPPSDVFSLGAVLTFAATGAGPFGSGSTPALVYRVVHSDPDIDGLPDGLRQLVRRCLAKDPAGRPTTDELLAELGASHAAEDWFSEPIARLLAAHAPPGFPPASPVPYPAAGHSPAPDAPAPALPARISPAGASPADVVPAGARPDGSGADAGPDSAVSSGAPIGAAPGAFAPSPADVRPDAPAGPLAAAAARPEPGLAGQPDVPVSDGDRPDLVPADASAGPALAGEQPQPGVAASRADPLPVGVWSDPSRADAPTGLIPAAGPADPGPADDVPADDVPADDVPTGRVRLGGRPGSGTAAGSAGPAGDDLRPHSGPPGPAPGDSGDRPPRRRRRAWVAAGLAVLVVLSASAAIALRAADRPRSGGSVQGPRSAASAPGGLSSSRTVPAAGARPAAATGSVPTVHGMTLSSASAALSARGFDNITYVSNCYGSSDVGHVVRQSPAGRARLALSTPVLLYLQASNCATVPNVSGMDLTQATAALKAAGFTSVPYQYDCYGFSTVGAVVSQSPAGRTRAATNQPVLLELQAGDCS